MTEKKESEGGNMVSIVWKRVEGTFVDIYYKGTVEGRGRGSGARKT